MQCRAGGTLALRLLSGRIAEVRNFPLQDEFLDIVHAQGLLRAIGGHLHSCRGHGSHLLMSGTLLDFTD